MSISDLPGKSSQATGRTSSGASAQPQHNMHMNKALPPLKRQDFNREGKLGSNVSIALHALEANRLRSLLTTLGIVIGVASVVSMVALIQGFSANITDTIASLGTNMIIIAPGTSNNIANSGLSKNGKISVSSRVTSVLPSSETTLSLTPADATAIASVTHVMAVSPVLSTNAVVIYGNQNWNTRIAGVDPSLAQIQNWTISEGAWFSTTDNRGARSVAVLGQTAYLQLFAASGDDPIGKTIRIRNQFLIEAVTLSLIGGIIGLLLGLLMGLGLTNAFAIPLVVTPTSLLLPFAVSGGVGVLFGAYPAIRAARLDPIEALRSL